MDPSDSYKAGKESGRNEVVELLIRKDERIHKLEAEKTELREALQNAVEVIHTLIGGKRIVNLDEAIAHYKSILKQ